MPPAQHSPEDNGDDTSDIFALFATVAKWIPRAVSPFLDVSSAFSAGLSGYSRKEYECREEFDAHLARFNQILKLNDDLPDMINDLRTRDPDLLVSLVQSMPKYMRDARAQDTNLMKKTIISFLPLDPHKDVVSPPIVDDQKSKRGWSHVWTARLLCPHEDREIFDQESLAYMKSVQEGKQKIRARNLPSFLYEEGTVYDAEHPDKGLFRGHVVIRALRLIYTGSSSAFTGHRKAARQSQAELHEMREVTPEALAYTCCQIYVNLSSVEQWTNRDGYFKFETFYKIIVELFQEPRTPWAIETLTFLTQKLPALKRKIKRKRGALSDDSEDDDVSDPTGILALQATRVKMDARVQIREPNNPIHPSQSHTPPESSPPSVRRPHSSDRPRPRHQISQSSPARSGLSPSSHTRTHATYSSPIHPPPSSSLPRHPNASQSSAHPRIQQQRVPIAPLSPVQPRPRPLPVPRVLPRHQSPALADPQDEDFYVNEPNGYVDQRSGLESEEETVPAKRRLFQRTFDTAADSEHDLEEENCPPVALVPKRRTTRNTTKKLVTAGTTKKRKS